MRRYLSLFLLLLLLSSGHSWAGETNIIRLSGPALGESLPFLVMAEFERFRPQGIDVRFVPWNSPDQLRAMIVGRQVDGALLTTAAASIFHNKGLETQVVVLQEAPVFIVSSLPGSNRLDDLTGDLYFPFGPGEMPELLFQAASQHSASNLTFRYTGSPLEAVNLMLAGRAQQAMLSEPAASLALIRSEALAGQGARKLNKIIDLRAVWKERFKGRRLLQSCLAFFGLNTNNSERQAAFSRAYIEACGWIAEHPNEALELASKRFPALAAQAVDGRLPGLDIRPAKGPEAMADALFFLEKIHDLSPRSIGGAVPGPDFFEMRP
jgi:NitT/TauT family transport system substrate-binding protein